MEATVNGVKNQFIILVIFAIIIVMIIGIKLILNFVKEEINLSTIDIISQICVFCDFPLWRYNIQKYRDRINKVILYPSRHHGVVDLENFWKQVFPETWVTPIAIDYGKEDWRQAETVPCLSYSTSEWIWFREADFFVKDWNKLWEDIEKLMRRCDMFGWWNPTHFPYVHPSCLFIKRELLEKTNKDFSAHPEINGGDHFAMLTKEARNQGATIISLQDIGYKDWEDAFHLGGLTYVYQNFKEDFSNPIGVKRPEIFQIYNQMQRLAPVEQNQEFINLTYQVEEQLKKMNLSVNPETSYWEDFFKS